MKTSIDLPDELYRRVKARSALEGRAVREVATELLAQWVDRKPSPPSTRGRASTKGARKHPTGLVGQLKPDRR